MSKIRMGIIGLGFGQYVHAPAFQSHSGFDVVAICGRNGDKAGAAAKNLGIPNSFSSWEELLRSDIDAISIATPPPIQEKIALAASSRKLALFCEKPLAASLQGARDMVSAAGQHPCMVDFQFMEIPAWKQTKTLIDGGAIGKIRHVSVNWHVETYVNKTGASSWKSSFENGGGALYSFASHTLYYLERLLGRIRGLFAHLYRDSLDIRTADTSASLSMEFESGGTVSVNICTNAILGSGHRIEFYGTDASLVLVNTESDYARGFRLFRGVKGTQKLVEEPTFEIADGKDGRMAPVQALIGRFAEWILDGKQASPNFADGLRVQMLMETAREANLLKRWIDVPAE